MSYAATNRTRRSSHAPKRGRDGSAYHAAVSTVRQRALAGEPCHFWRKRPQCPGRFDWRLHHNHPYAFTAHHLDHLMHGGPAVADPNRMAPAHRACNAWDGLRQQNARRRQAATPTVTRRSRAW